MKRITRFCLVVVMLALLGKTAGAQDISRRETLIGIPARQTPAARLPLVEGFEDHVRDGKLVLTLDDAIHLALSNNTNISIDVAAVDFAKNAIGRQYAPFDPAFAASFTAQRSKSPAFQELQGAAILDSLSQITQMNYSQTFQTGTNFQTTFTFDKFATNSSFYFLNPYLSPTLQLQVTQPLLRNFGLFPNRAPIVIAQRGLRQARSVFESQVSDLLQQTIAAYWNIVLSRDGLTAQQKSFDEAQASYDRDKKALSLGALPPLDIYRSESEVAARRVTAIQAEYALVLAKDAFRHFIGADRDINIHALDIDPIDDPEPSGPLATVDIRDALQRALVSRAEFEAVRQSLTVDDLRIRLAHNQLRPDLQLAGSYSTTGLSGNEFNFDVPPALISSTGLTDSLDQILHFNNPTYGVTLTLKLPLKNHAAAADLGDALVSRRRDQYLQENITQLVSLDVTNAVHQLEQAETSLAAARVSVDLARKSLAAEQRKYDLGSQTAFFVLDAQTQLAQAEFLLSQAKTNYQLSLTALDHATGELIAHHHLTLKP